MTEGVFYTADGKLMAAGERPRMAGKHLEAGEAPPLVDRPLPEGKRNCTNCRQKFQPTIKRRRLCAGCFARATRDAAGPFEPVGEADPNLL